MRALGQEEASKHHGATRTKPAGKGCASTRVPVHPAGTSPKQRMAERGGMAAVQDAENGLSARSHHAAGFILNASCPLKPAMLGGRRHGCPRDLDAQLQQRPSGTLPASATAFSPSALSQGPALSPLPPPAQGLGDHLLCVAPTQARPSMARCRLAPTGTSAGTRHRPYPAPSAGQQGSLLQPSTDGSVGCGAPRG